MTVQTTELNNIYYELLKHIANKLLLTGFLFHFGINLRLWSASDEEQWKKTLLLEAKLSQTWVMVSKMKT